MRLAIRCLDDPEGDVAGAAGNVENLVALGAARLSEAIIASFQARCSPMDITSFMTS
jgi:hypothetical protein